MTTNEFLDIILANPTLTTHGFGVDNGSEETLETERANLESCYDEAQACEAFLMNCKKTVHPHKGLGSTYHFKHSVEKFTPQMYIPEGALILAAIHLGFKMKRIPNRTSVYLNISKSTKINGKYIY